MTPTWVARLEPGSPPRVTGSGLEAAERGGVRVLISGALFGEDAPAETVLDAYLRAGRAAFGGLRGRFTLLVWDGPRGELLALRDPLGVRSLFHARAGGALLLSPSLDALRDCPGVDRSIDPVYVAGQLVLGLPSRPDETAFPAVRRLPAGHLLRSRGTAVTVERYWELPAEARREPEDTQERFDALLEQAVRRCQPEGRAAIMLSGGIDSALIAAASAQVGTRAPLALSILNPTPEASEEATQRAVAAELGLELIAVAPDEVVPPGEILTRSLRLAPPPAWPNGALQSVGDALMRRARDAGCRSVLDGNGGDEWLMPFASLASERLSRLDARAVRDMRRAWPYLFPGASSRQVVRQLFWEATARPIALGAARRALPRQVTARLRRRTRRRAAARFPDWLLPGRREALAEWWIDRYLSGPMLGMHRAEKENTLVSPFTAALLDSHADTTARTAIDVFSPLWDADLIAFVAALPQGALVAGGRPKRLALGYLRSRLTFADRWPGKTYGDSVIEVVMAREGHLAFGELDAMPALNRAGVVDAATLSTLFESGHTRKSLALWDVMAVEAWMRIRL